MESQFFGFPQKLQGVLSWCLVSSYCGCARDRCYRGDDVLFTVNILVALVVGGGDVIVVVGGSSVAALVLASVLSWRLWCFVCVCVGVAIMVAAAVVADILCC